MDELRPKLTWDRLDSYLLPIIEKERNRLMDELKTECSHCNRSIKTPWLVLKAYWVERTLEPWLGYGYPTWAKPPNKICTRCLLDIADLHTFMVKVKRVRNAMEK